MVLHANGLWWTINLCKSMVCISGDSLQKSSIVYRFGLLIRRSTVRICQDPPPLQRAWSKDQALFVFCFFVDLAALASADCTLHSSRFRGAAAQCAQWPNRCVCCTGKAAFQPCGRTLIALATPSLFTHSHPDFHAPRRTPSLESTPLGVAGPAGLFGHAWAVFN